MTRYIWVYMTAKDGQQAAGIGRKLVEERLAACVNILGGIRSLYWWDGRLHDERETAFVAKTRSSLLPELSNRVRELHSYECPCIVALPIAGGNADFLGWLDAQTKKTSKTLQSLRRPPSKPARRRK